MADNKTAGGTWEMPMPRLISVAEEARLKAAGEWPPPPTSSSPEHELASEPGDQIVPPSGRKRKRMPRHTQEAGIAAFYDPLRAEPPWEVERTARKKAEAEAAAKADKDEGG